MARIQQEIAAIRQAMAIDYAGALARAKALVEAAPDDFDAMMLVAYLHSYTRDYSSALAQLRAAARLRPGSTDVRFNLAYCTMQSGDVAGAADLFAQAAEAARTRADVALLAALCRLWSGANEDGFRALAEVQRRFSTYAPAMFFALRSRLPGAPGPRDFLLALRKSPEAAMDVVSFVNRFDLPGWHQLDDKAALSDLVAARAADGNPCRHVPDAGRLPSELARLAAAHKAAPSLWISKAARLFGGQGMVIVASPEAAPGGEARIVQRYIERPLLVRARKSHMRLYLLLESFAPLRAQLYGNGIVRFAPQPYDIDDTTSEARHVTNTLRHKLANEKPVVMALPQFLGEAASLVAPEKLSGALADLAREVVALIAWSGIPAKTSPADPRTLPPKLVGLDVVIDERGRPWLMEIERYPALGGSSGADDEVNRRLFQDFVTRLAGAPTPQGAWTDVSQSGH